MDAIELLTSQHHTLEALVRTVLAWPDETVCRQRLQRLSDALMLHTVAEESVLYAELWPQPADDNTADDTTADDHTEAADEARRAAQDHAVTRHHIASLLAMPPLSPLSPAFERGLMALQALLQAHHVDEETRLFPLARQRLTAQRRSELGRRLEQLQLQLLRQGPVFSHDPADIRSADVQPDTRAHTLPYSLPYALPHPQPVAPHVAATMAAP